MARAERALPALAALALAGVLALLLYDATFLTSDAIYALAWGAEIARGGTPEVTAPLQPVFHPLPTAAGAVLSPLGTEGMLDGYRTLSILSLAGLAYAAFRLGKDLAGAGAGLLAAALLLSRPEVISFALSSTIDIPFTALVLLGTALALERPLANRIPTLLLLALAGLLRPEGWLLALGYGAWLVLRTRGRARVGMLALALAAPLIWAGADLVLSGEPLGTAGEARADFNRELAAAGYPDLDDSGDPERGSIAYHLEPVSPALADVLGWPLAIGGLAAAIAALLPPLRGGFRVRRDARREPDEGEPELTPAARAVVVALAALLVLAAILALRLLGFPFTTRFVLLPGAALAALFAAALLRFKPPSLWRAALVAVAAGVAVTLPADLAEIRDQRAPGRFAAASLAELTELTGSAAARAALSDCAEVVAGGDLTAINGAAVLAIELERDPAEIPIRRDPGSAPESVLLLLPEPGLGRDGEEGRPERALVARSGSWELWSRCPAP